MERGKNKLSKNKVSDYMYSSHAEKMLKVSKLPAFSHALVNNEQTGKMTPLNTNIFQQISGHTKLELIFSYRYLYGKIKDESFLSQSKGVNLD